jgi:ribosome-binding factor A
MRSEREPKSTREPKPTREPKSPRSREEKSPREREEKSPRSREEKSPRAREEKSPRAREPRRAAGPLGSAQPDSTRGVRVAGEIRRALQSALQRGLNDPRVQGMISLTDVEVSRDGSVAHVRVSVLPEERAPLSLSGLRAAAAFLRRQVMDGTRLMRVPRLEFVLDDRLKRQAKLDEALRDTAADGQDNPENPENPENQRDEG